MSYIRSLKAESIYPQQRYMWVADYVDGTGLCEFTKTSEGTLKNQIQAINKDKLNKFGLVGCGLSIYYDVIGGTFFINGRRISIKVVADTGESYMISGLGSLIYNDVISYKSGMAILDVNERVNNPNVKMENTNVINGYYFGFKGKPKINGVNFGYKNIMSITMNQPAYMDITLSSSKAFKGMLNFYVNQTLVDSIMIEFEKVDTNYNIKWNLKF